MSSPLLPIDDINDYLLSTVGITFIILGTIGNLSNIILFTQRSLRTLSTCITYLLAASIANIIDIYSYILLRALYGFNITPAYSSSIVCKLQLYLFYASFCTSSWFMVGCCADRYFSSSHNAILRRYSCMRTTLRMILFIIIFISLVYAQVFYCYDANQFNRPSLCFIRNNVCLILDTAYYFIFQCFGPPICMFIFGIGTFIHIRRGEQIRIEARNRANVNIIERLPIHIVKLRKNNRKILPMLIAQIILYIFCSLPLMFYKIYSTLQISIIRNNIPLPVENLYLSIAILLSFIDKIFSFYIYTLSSVYFRTELIRFLTQRCLRRRIVPEN
ncbi:unnamed protein product [Adineta steineri]|uniref:G-protein coupled receptors family 1 profile domain-containing protein n=1 Tax=Adineta steineri TaxID=433720 RepID=A0A814Q295_9BILA|nr:unnamed protein product [Adineta steineri]CAF3639089.1 unnamed protein product [Adineta steineri]